MTTQPEPLTGMVDVARLPMAAFCAAPRQYLTWMTETGNDLVLVEDGDVVATIDRTIGIAPEAAGLDAFAVEPRRVIREIRDGERAGTIVDPTTGDAVFAVAAGRVAIDSFLVTRNIELIGTARSAATARAEGRTVPLEEFLAADHGVWPSL